MNTIEGQFLFASSVIVAVATIVYTWITKQLVDETKRLRLAQYVAIKEMKTGREEQYKPHVAVFAAKKLIRTANSPSERMCIVIQNDGGGPAYKIKFISNDESTLAAFCSPIYGNGLGYLSPQTHLDIPIDSIILGNLWSSPRQISVHWKDGSGNVYGSDYDVNFNQVTS